MNENVTTELSASPFLIVVKDGPLDPSRPQVKKSGAFCPDHSCPPRSGLRQGWELECVGVGGIASIESENGIQLLKFL